jgi:hypothetical protein
VHSLHPIHFSRVCLLWLCTVDLLAPMPILYQTTRSELEAALKGIGQEVDFIDCSFPGQTSPSSLLVLLVYDL